MKKASSEYAQQYPESMTFEYDTSKFMEAVLTAEGKLHLRMAVSSAPMFNQQFQEGLAGDIGKQNAAQILDSAGFEINRQIAIRLLVE